MQHSPRRTPVSIYEDMNQCAPLQRLPVQLGEDRLNFLRRVRLRLCCFALILSGLGALYLVHGIAVYHIAQICHFEKSVENGIDLNDSRMSLSL